MAQIEGQITIDRPVETVFDFIANQCNEPLYNVEMLSASKVTEGPVGCGSRFHAVMRSGRREFPVDIEFTAFDRPKRLGSHSTAAGMNMDGELAFTPMGESTLMSWAWNVRPTGAMRIVSPLVAWIGRRQELRIWSALKRHLES